MLLPLVSWHLLFMTRWPSQFFLDNQSPSGSVLNTDQPESCIAYRSCTRQHEMFQYCIEEAQQGPG